MNRGLPLIVSGPSGSGKDTLLGIVLRRNPELRFSISCITRPPRGSETEDSKYRFVSVDEFKKMLENGAFLEYNTYLGNYYGTPRAPVEEALGAGRDIVLEVDVNGAAQIRRSLPEAVSIFIMPPSLETLRGRLLHRSTEAPGIAEKRLQEAVAEIRRAEEYDYIVVNDDLEEAAEQFCGILRGEKSKTERMKNFIDEVLKNA